MKSFLKSVQTLKNQWFSSSPVPVAASLPAGVTASDPVLTSLLIAVLNQHQRLAEEGPGFVRLPSGLCLSIQALEKKELGPERVKTATRITVWHTEFFPEGITEYQHALGKDESSALSEGIQNWINMDLVALEEAVVDYPQQCAVIELNTAAGESAAARYRQIILGPVAHLATLPEKKKEDHPFCPCCLMTETMEAFHDVLQTERLLGIRLFVSRDQHGQLNADCRVNGEDFPAALPLLTAYAEKWPQRGLEFRKQYVLVRSAQNSIHQKSQSVQASEDQTK
ncbi:DUF6348 family protein [Undibacterium crateris]|uniref:DUF6348 family protein n=1 Tax=Undibacterium crateris TaxID=2528175 RepID=UPI00138A2885|nr:DUF6348 family protein [Undibacterium crateris]NDI86320.1 hypothetical protein [Undibacterium crateris]